MIKKLLLLIIPAAILSLLPVSDTFAASVNYRQFGVYQSQWQECGTFSYREQLAWNQTFTACALRAFLAETSVVQSTGQYWGVTGKVNIVRRRTFQADGVERHKFTNLQTINVMSASHNGVGLTIDNQSVQTFVTDWQVSNSEKYQTLTIQYTAAGKGASNGSGVFRILIGDPQYAFMWPQGTTPYTNAIVYFENTGQSPTTNFAGSFDDGSSQQMINQNNTMINQNDMMIDQNKQINKNIVDGFDRQNQKEEQDKQNIQNQNQSGDGSANSSSQDATAQGTTLLGAFTAFVSALTSASPTNCQIDMDMGNLDMGNVDFCQLSPPPAFQVLASIFLILFCVPLSVATARKVISLFRSFQ